MKGKQWRHRLLCCFLACAVLLGGVLCCLPVRAGAIVPIGFVQSALASYVTSSGYKLYNDNGTGSDILGSLGELYDDYVTISNSTISGQLANLAFLANSPYVYQDNSGQIVVSKVAADIFQDFADWIQTEYSITVGSDTPTQVVSASGGGGSVTNGTSVSNVLFPYLYTVTASVTWQYVTSKGTTIDYYANTSVPVRFALFKNSNSSQLSVILAASDSSFLWSFNGGSSSSARVSTVNGNTFYWGAVQTGLTSSSFALTNTNGFVSDGYFDLLAYNLIYGEIQASGGVAALGATLSQAVADVIGQAQDDDAVVIGVGAGVGATAQDIADIVAQGVKAQTLDPSVSITAEAVIDTPVQPYPDIDGLGLPTLGAALVSRFPFCVPWDFVDTLKILNAEPIPPVFDVTLVPASVAARWGVSGNYTIHVDLTSAEYAKLFVALRWGTLVGFCLGLALLTKRLIWTA